MPVAGPNIVMVMVDDASAHMFADLPHIDEDIVLEGATIPNFLYEHPLCAPSRTTILRGQYEHNHGLNGNQWNGKSALWHFQDLGLEDSNLATWFKAAGYQTALVGKYMNGYGEDEELEHLYYTPPGWSFFFGVGHDAADPYNYRSWFDRDGVDGPLGGYVDYGSNPLTDYLTIAIKDKAIEFLDIALDPDDPDPAPFLLIVTPKAPHYPATPHQIYEDTYDTWVVPDGWVFRRGNRIGQGRLRPIPGSTQLHGHQQHPH